MSKHTYSDIKKVKVTNITNFMIFDFETVLRETETSWNRVKCFIRASIYGEKNDAPKFPIFHDPQKTS